MTSWARPAASFTGSSAAGRHGYLPDVGHYARPRRRSCWGPRPRPPLGITDAPDPARQPGDGHARRRPGQSPHRGRVRPGALHRMVHHASPWPAGARRTPARPARPRPGIGSRDRRRGKRGPGDHPGGAAGGRKPDQPLTTAEPQKRRHRRHGAAGARRVAGRVAARRLPAGHRPRGRAAPLSPAASRYRRGPGFRARTQVRLPRCDVAA